MTRESSGEYRFALHAINGIGAGHISRQVALARHIRDASPKFSSIILAEGRAAADISTDIPFIPLQSTVRLAQEGGPAAESLRRAAISMSFAALSSFQPNVIIHDTFVWPPLVEMAAAFGAVQVLTLRPRPDIEEYLGDPHCPAKRMDVVIVPDTADCNPRMRSALEDRNIDAIWTGPIYRQRRMSREAAREHYGISIDDTAVVVMSGGGSGVDSKPHFERALRALGEISSRALKVSVVLGPLFPGFVAIPPGFRHELQIFRAVSDLPDFIGAADLVICRGGYNSVNEVTSAGVAVVATPAGRRADDQSARLRQLETDGLCSVIDESCIDAEMAAVVERAIKAGASPYKADPPDLTAVIRHITLRADNHTWMSRHP